MMRAVIPALLHGALVLALASCATPAGHPVAAPEPAEAAGPGPLPAVPRVTGPVAIRVVYPADGAVVDVRDSSFLFGSVGTGDATLTINGTPVRVWPNGAWLAWLPFPRADTMRFDLVAAAGTDSARASLTLRRPPSPLYAGTLWLDSASVSPAGRAWWPAGEYLPVSVRAAEGATVRVRLADGTLIPLLPDQAYADVPWGIRAFDADSANLRRAARSERYRGALRGRAIGASPGPLLPGLPAPATPADSSAPVIEAIRGADTVRVRWPIRLALLDSMPQPVELDDDPGGTGTGDSLTVGRALPGGTYHWFFPTGTRATVTGRLNGDLRLELSEGTTAWVPAADARPLPAGTLAGRATVGSVSLRPTASGAVLRIPVSRRVPFDVDEAERTLTLRLHGAAGDIDWMRYGPADSLVTTMRWRQRAADQVELVLDLRDPVWGYRLRWDRSDLLMELKRPPVIEPAAPFRGLLIVVDPGHPPAGAMGPTGLREAEANLGIAEAVAERLAHEGARVVMTRRDASPLDLWPRAKLADSLGADLLVSIHNNALPDGVNPFTNHGTSVFYNQPRSIPLARAVQAGLLRTLGQRDLGVGRGDLALVRPTWMPAILTEGLFLMLPDQEHALRTSEGQRRYADGVVQGIRAFLLERVQSR